MSIRINPNIQPKFIKFEPNKVEIPTDETPVVIEGEKAPEAKETSSVSGYLDDIENNNTDSDIIYKYMVYLLKMKAVCNHIQTASDKLEKLHKRQRVGQFGQLLINNNEPVRPTRQWTFIR